MEHLSRYIYRRVKPIWDNAETIRKAHVSAEWFNDNSRIDSWSSFIYALPMQDKEHDGWSLRTNNAVVSDGATPLSSDWGNDLYFWANTLTALFAENGQDMDKSLEKVWQETIEFGNSLYTPAGFRRTMGCSHVRFNNHKIEVLTVGDTRVILRKTDGNFVKVFDSRLAKWEEKADARIDAGELTGPQAAWHNRLKVGQLDGYEVVADEPRVGEEAIFYTVDEYKIDNIIICSDGLWRIFEDDLETMFQVVQPANPQNLQKRLEKIAPIGDDLTFIRLDRR